MNRFFLNSEEFECRTKEALLWLLRSIDVHDGHGSSAYYTQFWPPFRWAPAYPETTGYIIETLYDYCHLYPNLLLTQYAERCADWLCSLQLPSGALPGGLAGSRTPSVFNTGQMLIGLLRAFEETGNEAYLDVVKSATIWLIENMSDEGKWVIGAYVAGYNPSYYTRVLWPILWANRYINDLTIDARIRKAFHHYREQIQSNRSVQDWSFRPKQKAFTHTIAYTIRGYYEASLLLDDEELNQIAISLIEKLMLLREIRGELAGWYDEQWQGSTWFTCLTGNCQLSIICSKVYLQTGDVRFFNTALKMFEDTLPHQNMSSNLNKRGAIPGSSPFWGRYLALRYPNWATKFFLDAYLLLAKALDRVERM